MFAPLPGCVCPLLRCVCPLWDFSRVRSPRSRRAAPAGTALPAPPLEAPGILPSHRLPATSRLAQHPGWLSIPPAREEKGRGIRRLASRAVGRGCGLGERRDSRSSPCSPLSRLPGKLPKKTFPLRRCREQSWGSPVSTQTLQIRIYRRIETGETRFFPGFPFPEASSPEIQGEAKPPRPCPCPAACPECFLRRAGL